MTKDAYPALFHFIHKQMYDITYPVTRTALLQIAGDRPVHTDWDQTVSFRELMENVKKDSFSCASDFYSALIASMG